MALKEALLPEFDQEMAITRRMLDDAACISITLLADT